MQQQQQMGGPQPGMPGFGGQNFGGWIPQPPTQPQAGKYRHKIQKKYR